MLRAVSLAFGQLGDRAILAILLKSLLLTLLVFAVIGGAMTALLAGADPCDWLGLEACPLSGGEGGMIATVTTLGLVWLIFPAVAIGVVSIFSDDIVTAVERRHYPQAATAARPLGWAGGAMLGLASSLRIVVYNLVALPFYMLLLVTGIGPLVLFLAVNALAMGRDLAAMVAARHVGRGERAAFLATTRGPRALLGLITTGLFMIPILNLLAPVIGAAMATHLYHRRGR